MQAITMESRKLAIVFAAIVAVLVSVTLAVGMPQTADAKTVKGSDSYSMSFGKKLQGKAKITSIKVKGDKVTVKGSIVKLAHKKATKLKKGTYKFKIGKLSRIAFYGKGGSYKEFSKKQALNKIKNKKFKILNFGLTKGKVTSIIFSE